MPRNRKNQMATKPAQGTGQPGNKDRKAHDDRRGKKALTLADLARELPNEDEILRLFALMEDESDRGCALVCGSFVEAGVRMAVSARMVADVSVLAQIMTDASAPLSTFSAKIKAGLALGMYGPKTAKNLALVKDIRNTFAHALRPLSFDHPTIAAACQKLTPIPNYQPPLALTGPRGRFTMYCRYIFGEIYRDAMAEGGKTIAYRLP